MSNAKPTIVQTWAPVAEQMMEVAKTTFEILRGYRFDDSSPLAAASSPLATAMRAEIIAVGRKLWERQYVDANAGNISVRLGQKYLLCTPTMVSKRDMEPADICLSDLEGNILAGDRPRTSEILLHMEIYRGNPQAQAVVHCHPPAASAFAMTGTTPPGGLISEVEASIGPVAVAPYETPGTRAFAETVRPFVRDHNTILLSNHGIVCWADTVSHAEWLVETYETYCKTYLLAQQLGRPLSYIPDNKIEEILEIKRRLGLPDARLADRG